MANTEKIVVQVVVQGEKDLKNLEKRTGTTTKSFGKMAVGVLGAVSAFRQIAQVVGSAIRSFRDFEFQMAKVKAITGASTSEFLKLTNSAKLLGRTTFFTATQVAQLQTNYGKLGFTTDEILKAQSATLALATATDTDLARAAIVAGAAVRGFGLDASETGRITDVMAVSFTSSAMDIEKFQTSMTKVAPIAAAAGISMESTTAVMSKLTDTGIEASIAGTSLRNIFLKMQDSSSDLSKHLGFTVNSSEDLERALLQLNAEGLSNEQIMGLVDLRQVATFNTMIRGAEDVANLTEKFNNANGSLKEMVGIIEDNLEGDMKKLTSAFDGLQQELGEELSPTLRVATQDLTDLTNEATDNSDAIVEVTNKFIKLSRWIAKILPGIGTLKTTFNGLLEVFETDGWREFSDFIGLTTEKADPTGKSFLEKRAEKLNNELQKTLNLNSLNLKQTKKSVTATEEAIKAREKELESLRLGEGMTDNAEYEAGLKERNDAEEQRINNEIKQLEHELKKKREILSVHQDKVWTTTQSQKKIQENIDKVKTAEDFQNEKDRIDREARELENTYKELLINEQITQETYDVMAFDSEQQRLQDMFDLHVKYGEDVSVINGEILSNELKMITDVAAAQAKAAQDKLDQDLKEKKERLAKIDGMQEIGNQLILIAGEEENLNAVKKVGIQISQAAALAKSFEAMADYGKAISSAAADSPWWMKIVNVVGLIAAMASTLSLIKSIKNSFGDGGVIQEFANGGMVNGRSHAQGGEKFAVGGRVVELEGGEAVINKKSTSMFRGQLSAMNSAGGGVKFADGGLLNQPSFSQQQFNALGQSQMMGAMGGASKVVVVEADITNSQRDVAVIQSDSII